MLRIGTCKAEARDLCGYTESNSYIHASEFVSYLPSFRPFLQFDLRIALLCLSYASGVREIL